MYKNRAILFDRDGVVNYRIVGDYVKTIEEFQFIPDFITFFKFANELGYMTFLVTNQQGVGKKLMSEEQLQQLFDSMQSGLMYLTGSKFDKIYYCTELAESKSKCRKPNPGMLLQAIEEYSIDLEESFMIGDSKADIIAGNAAGLKTILLAPSFQKKIRGPNYTFQNFYEIMYNFYKIL
jgi:histidinol-phosphate phosphatase family protein